MLACHCALACETDTIIYSEEGTPAAAGVEASALPHSGGICNEECEIQS